MLCGGEDNQINFLREEQYTQVLPEKSDLVATISDQHESTLEGRPQRCTYHQLTSNGLQMPTAHSSNRNGDCRKSRLEGKFAASIVLMRLLRQAGYRQFPNACSTTLKSERLIRNDKDCFSYTITWGKCRWRLQLFQLLNFQMPKRDWTPEEIEQVHNWLKVKMRAHIIASNFPKATSSDIAKLI